MKPGKASGPAGSFLQLSRDYLEESLLPRIERRVERRNSPARRPRVPQCLHLSSIGIALGILMLPVVAMATTPLIDTRDATAICPAETPALCAAIRAPDSPSRTTALTEELRAVFLSSDGALKKKVWRYLQSSASADLEPVAEVLFDLSAFATGSCQYGASWADDIKMRYGPRAWRLQVFAEGIWSGTLKLPHGTELPRRIAVSLAAWQGLNELEPAAVEYLATMSPERIKRERLDTVITVFELCAGAVDASDAPRAAMHYLLQFPDANFRDRMDGDAQFRETVLSISRVACHDSETSDENASEACRLLGALVVRQNVYAGRGVRPVCPQESDVLTTFTQPRSWLGDLTCIAIGGGGGY